MTPPDLVLRVGLGWRLLLTAGAFVMIAPLGQGFWALRIFVVVNAVLSWVDVIVVGDRALYRRLFWWREPVLLDRLLRLEVEGWGRAPSWVRLRDRNHAELAVNLRLYDGGAALAGYLLDVLAEDDAVLHGADTEARLARLAGRPPAGDERGGGA